MKQCCLGFCFLLFSMIGFCQKADLVLLNGKILTLKNPGDRAEAITIIGHKIIAVGSSTSIKNLVGVIDLQGNNVVPGFNDVHQQPSHGYSRDKPYAVLRLDAVKKFHGNLQT